MRVPQNHRFVPLAAAGAAMMALAAVTTPAGCGGLGVRPQEDGGPGTAGGAPGGGVGGGTGTAGAPGGTGGAMGGPGTGGTGGRGGTGGTAGSGGRGGAGGAGTAGRGGAGPGGAGGRGGAAGGGGGGMGGFAGTRSTLTCSPNETCRQEEVDQYNTCLWDQCDAEFRGCFGDDYRMANFSGPCASFIACTDRCDCGDRACQNACGNPPLFCLQCLLLPLQDCVNASTCPRPPCYDGLLPDAGAPPPPPDDGGVAVDAPAPRRDAFVRPDVPPPVLPPPVGTCNDFLRCCLSVTEPGTRNVCLMQYGLVQFAGDLVCGVVYAQYRASGVCR
jgi:hypothetical protein